MKMRRHRLFYSTFGGFVTAKHVLFDNDKKSLPTLYGIQTTSSNERHIRSIRHLIAHPNADICIGFLDKRRLRGGLEIDPQIAIPFTQYFQKLNNGDNIRTYAFPLTKRYASKGNKFEFIFTGKWSVGKIVDFHEDGSPLLKNRCYQTK